MLAFGPFKDGDEHPIAAAWATIGPTRIRVAAAFASEGGVRTLLDVLPNPAWEQVPSYWLVGIENGLTQPEALSALGAIPAADVRVPGGQRALASGTLRSPQFFHPKIYVFDDGTRMTLVSASANLTEGGLTRNVEQYLVWSGLATDDTAVAFESWWQRVWRAADPADEGFISEYASVRPRVRPPAPEIHAAGPVQEAEPAPTDLKGADTLWIEALRPLEGGSNNQLELMLTAHHFFFPDAEPDAAQRRSLKFVDASGREYANPERVVHYNGPPLMPRGNGMWRVRLPTAAEGLDGYQEGGVVLRFRRTDEPDRYRIEIAPIGGPEAESWARSSRKIASVPGPPERKTGWS